MRVMRWQPTNAWGQLQQLQHEMNRLFERWDGEGGMPAAGFPAANLWEDHEAVHVEMELPGLELKDLEIFVLGGNQLSIRGSRREAAPEKAVVHRQERSLGNFTRLLTLPTPVDADKVDARLENGILSLRLAKHEAAKPRKIAVKG